MDKKKFVRSCDKKIAGVAAGIGIYFEIDPILVRAGFVLLTFFGGTGIILYLILMLIMPDENGDFLLKNSTQKGEKVINIDNFQNADNQQNTEYSTTNEQTSYTAQEEDKTATSTANKDKRNKWATIIVGTLLIYMGIIFLFRQFCPLFRAKIYVPAFLIFAGVLIFVLGFKKKKD